MLLRFSVSFPDDPNPNKYGGGVAFDNTSKHEMDTLLSMSRQCLARVARVKKRLARVVGLGKNEAGVKAPLESLGLCFNRQGLSLPSLGSTPKAKSHPR